MSAYTDDDWFAVRNVVLSGPFSSASDTASAVLAAVAPAIAARALREAAKAYRARAAEVFWRDDAPFHSDGRFHAGQAADWLHARADEIARP